jgi:predicted AlkP superfamily phosphohydrolase/phosphomutase
MSPPNNANSIAFRSPLLSKTKLVSSDSTVITFSCQNGVMACPRRVLLIGLDGFDAVLAKHFAEDGLLPNFARLQNQGACFDLDHGRDKYSGLSWEHLSSGIRPRDGGRWSAVTFNHRTYQATQDHTVVCPFLADLSGVRSVIFDFPYFDLSKAPNVRGITSWGSHDPGVGSASRPDGLHQQITKLFGPYPAPEWIYGFCWPSAQKAHAAGEALAQAAKVRSQASRWLLQQCLPDWDLGVVVISESHSAIEPLWHGVDPNHPLHGLHSARPAAAALRKVYCAIDDLIGELYQAFPDTVLVLVAMHGMGQNDSDVPAMALLPELLYRLAFGSAYMRPVEFPEFLPDGTPLIAEDAHWGDLLSQAVPKSQLKFHQRVARRINRIAAKINPRRIVANLNPGVDLSWMPAARYSPFWPKMSAFALPSFYDGRVRINVVGREARGKIRASEYAETCQQIREVVSECRNLLNGKPVVSEVYCPKQNPHEVGPSEADVYIVWEGAPLGFSHPRLGNIGPLPYLRTGGHTGKYGFLSIVGDNIPAGQLGVASSFDVVPTIIELLGQHPLPSVSGDSLLQRVAPFRSRSVELSH